MNATHHSEFEDLLSDLIDGTISESGRARLNRMIERDPDLLNRVAEHLQISELLSQQFPIRQRESFLTALEDHIKAPDLHQGDVFVTGVFKRVRRERDLRRFAIAAVISFLLIPASWFGLRNMNRPVVAQAFHVDSNGNLSTPENVREGGRIDLDQGIIQLKFENGAIVAVESPASFKVVSGSRMRLFSGKLNAWCPDTAHGFQVLTHGTTLTDLGTSFGVEASAGGESDFVVIEGSINLRKGRQTMNLIEGAAVRTNSSSDLAESRFETSPFERTWAITSGIIATTGAVVPAKPDTPERLARLRNDSEVMVVPEARAIPFDSAIWAEITEPGHLEITSNFVPSKVISADPGRVLHSYLLRVDPESELGGPEHIHFEGSVTFDRDVIAIILERGTLEASDERFTKGKWPDPADLKTGMHRGLEINWNTKIHDQVSLSEDRRTVRIAFHTGSSTDDIRVITAE